jgi:hypothetical protein
VGDGGDFPFKCLRSPWHHESSDPGYWSDFYNFMFGDHTAAKAMVAEFASGKGYIAGTQLERVLRPW